MFNHIFLRELDFKVNYYLKILKLIEGSLILSATEEFQLFHKAFVNTIDLDINEYRYLLSGNGNGAICIHDLHQVYQPKKKTSFPIVASINNMHEQRHLFSVSTVQWHAVDNGLFTSSGADKFIKIWDANLLKVASQIQLNDIINKHQMSSTLLLVAMATTNSNILLVDIRCGSSIQTLVGHRGNKGVLTVAWRPFNEYHLVSGGNDGKMLLWDVRRSKSCLQAFDQHNSQILSASNASHITSHEGSVVSIKFLSTQSDLILSVGSDETVRLWNAETGRNQMLNYGPIPISSPVPIQIAIGNSGSIGYIPSGNDITVIDIFSGHILSSLRGHFSKVLCCESNDISPGLISGGRDNNILYWSPLNEQTDDDYSNHGNEKKRKFVQRIAGSDNWSDDD